MIAEKYFQKYLGLHVKDCVTGFEGVVSSICFDLYGCVQCVVTPKARDGKRLEGEWYDAKRLTVTEGERVLPLPGFAQPDGPENKPVPR